MPQISRNTEFLSAIGFRRQEVRTQLWATWWERECIICGWRILLSDAVDLHEGIFKRGDTPGLEWQAQHVDRFFHPYNCVLVHHHCHEAYGQSSKTRDKVVRHKAHLYGQEEIVFWMQLLREDGLTLADEFLRMYFNKSILSMKGESSQ